MLRSFLRSNGTYSIALYKHMFESRVFFAIKKARYSTFRKGPFLPSGVPVDMIIRYRPGFQFHALGVPRLSTCLQRPSSSHLCSAHLAKLQKGQNHKTGQAWWWSITGISKKSDGYIVGWVTNILECQMLCVFETAVLATLEWALPSPSPRVLKIDFKIGRTIRCNDRMRFSTGNENQWTSKRDYGL